MMALTQLVTIGALTVVALGPGQNTVSPEPFDSRDRSLAQGRPYANLFTTPQKQDEPFKFQFPNKSTTVKPDQQPRVICGMVTIPKTPDLDPKMIVAGKADPKIDSKIRMIEPQICDK